jgi:Leucine-rich repeat (LRR) protein
MAVGSLVYYTGAKLDRVLQAGPTLFELAKSVVVKNLGTHPVSEDSLTLCLQKNWDHLKEALQTTYFKTQMDAFEVQNGSKPTMQYFEWLNTQGQFEEPVMGMYELARGEENQAWDRVRQVLVKTYGPKLSSLREDCDTVEDFKKWCNDPSKIVERSEVWQVILNDSELTVLPREVLQLPALPYLHLSRNGLDHFPEGSEGSCHAFLEYLGLDSNLFEEVPPTIGLCSRLTHLKLSNNHINTIAKEIFGLTSLVSLELSDNRIVEIPSEIGKLRCLKVLNLSANYICEIPSELGDCALLEQVKLSKNRIHTLPRVLRQLTNLAYITLGGNLIREIPQGLFAETVDVQV